MTAVGNGRRALLVSGSPQQWQESLKGTLESAGFTVKTADSGEKGLEALARGMFALIIVDDSCTDMRALEIVLNVQDVAPYEPVVLVVSDEANDFRPVFKRRGVFFSGSAPETVQRLPEAMEKAKGLAINTSEPSNATC